MLASQELLEPSLVLEASDGDEALRLLASEAVDLVLLDLLMPVTDGYQVLQHMRDDSRLRNIPVIMISAVSELENLVRCIEAGAEDYLPKPFNAMLLRARVRSSLEKKRQRDESLRQLGAVSRDPGYADLAGEHRLGGTTRLLGAGDSPL